MIKTLVTKGLNEELIKTDKDFFVGFVYYQKKIVGVILNLIQSNIKLAQIWN